MKIAKLELENVKRVRALEVIPAPSGLTVIGGRNGQGKTSVLDAIAWALGGEKYRPTSPRREDSVLPPRLHVVLDNGIVVDRDGKNSALRVTDPSGRRAGQALLDEFVEKLALDLPRFLSASGRGKASILLRVIGMEDRIRELDSEESALYNRRHAIGQIADQKEKHAAELTDYPDAPEEPVSAADLIQRQQEILRANARNQELRSQAQAIETQAEHAWTKIEDLKQKLREDEEALREWTERYQQLVEDLTAARKTAEDLRDESTEELENALREVERTNEMVRANLDKAKALDEAAKIRAEYDDLSARLDQIRKQRADLLTHAALPLPGLSVEKGELLYKGRQWDCMSGSEQMIVAVAIVRALNPRCQFVLLDKTEQLDPETLETFGRWMEKEGLQGICTRVSTGAECEIILEDGLPAAPALSPAPELKSQPLSPAPEPKSQPLPPDPELKSQPLPPNDTKKDWKAGEF